jgi:hypothetical protein
MRHLLCLLPILALAASLLAAQEPVIPTGSYNSLNGLYSGLLDPSRVTMSQSLSMSYSTWGKTGLFSNLYSNRINYRISDKLDLDLNLAVRFTPQQLNDRALFQQGRARESLFLPSFGLRYRPASGVLLEFQYQQVDPLAPQRYWGW